MHIDLGALGLPLPAGGYLTGLSAAHSQNGR